MKRGVHRVAAGTKRARQMAQAKGARVAAASPFDAFNAIIDNARNAELARRKARRGGK